MNCQAMKLLDSSKSQGNKEILIRSKQIANTQGILRNKYKNINVSYNFKLYFNKRNERVCYRN